MPAPLRKTPLPAGEPRPGLPELDVERFLDFLLNIGVVSVVTQELRREIELHLWLRRLCDEADSPPRAR